MSTRRRWWGRGGAHDLAGIHSRRSRGADQQPTEGIGHTVELWHLVAVSGHNAAGLHRFRMCAIIGPSLQGELAVGPREVPSWDLYLSERALALVLEGGRRPRGRRPFGNEDLRICG